MNKISAIITAALIAVATPSLAQTYVQGDIGHGFQTKDADLRDGNTALNFAVGHDYGKVRLEAALFSFGQGDNAGGSIGRVDGQALSANAYVEPFTVRGFTPYVTAGVGYGWFNGSGVNVNNEDGVVYNVGLGTSYAIDNKWKLVGGYRYFISDENIARQNNGGFDNFRQHVVTVGVRYTFN